MADVQKVDWILTAEDRVSKVLEGIGGKLVDLKSSYLGLAAAASAALGAAGIGSFISDSISYRAALEDFKNTTGDSVGTLDALSRQARISGFDLESLRGIVNKFSKNLNDSQDEGKAAAQALQAIGLNIEELRAMKPGEAFFEVAKAMDQFADGSGKIAAMIALGGKNAAAALPYMKDLAQLQELVGKRTDEDVKAAKDLERAWRELKQASTDAKDSMIDDLIPALRDVAKAMADARKAGEGWLETLTAGIQAATGSDEYKNAVRIVQLSERRWEIEKEMATLSLIGMKDSPRYEELAKGLAKVNAELKQTLDYQHMLEDAAADAAAATEAEEKDELDFNAQSKKEYDEETKRLIRLSNLREEAAAAWGVTLGEFDKLNLDKFDRDKKREDAETDLLAKNLQTRTKYQEDAERRAEELAEKEYAAKYKFQANNLAAYSYFFGALSVLMTSHSKRMFEIGKMAAIAQTIVDTIASAQGAYFAMVKIPIVGPALAVAAAAAATIAGIARVQQIRATQFSGGGTPSGATGTFPASPVTGQPTGGPFQSTTGQSGQGPAQIIIQGPIYGDRDFVDNVLIPAIQDAISNRDVVVIQTGSRNFSNIVQAARQGARV